ncbi:MAG TPA: M20/M25/M40 family metallo-hydrolase [Vicinamibacterales bacterium]|nr:M20/M25/M40 family metallo-hydrolase [Vicinamibacterales bacterium]
MSKITGIVLGIVVAGLVVAAEERPDQNAFWKIRQEGTANSHILATLHMLTDVYGPRLTGSPNLKAAGEWAMQQMRTWGMTNAHLEPWDFGHPGWVNERLVAHLVSPVKDALVVEALSWTPGTNGVARAAAVQITLPPQPITQGDLTVYLEGIKATVKGRIVLVGPHVIVPVTFNAVPLRREDAEVQTQMNTPPVVVAVGPRGQGPAPDPSTPRPLTNNQVQEQLNQFLVANGALVRINDAGRDHGQIRAFQNQTYDVAKAPPTVVMRNEDYGRISRLLADKRPVELEFEIVNRTYPEGRTNYNVVAEIPGGDKAQEVVMLGGHLDSWHSATGATDNAIGCAIMMEAARIIKTIGLQPRRTIRVALWSGEEQGLLGSQAYVMEHFGTFEEPKADYDKFAAYFNVDSGTGRVRGLTVFGPPAAGTVLREAASSFKDLGLLGATTTRTRATGGTDSTSFNAAGLPGINTLLDPIEYQTHTWHTNLDTYERIVEEDVKQSAIVMASMVYHLAMRDERLPRFSKEEMPRRQGAPPTPAPAATPAPPATPAPSSTGRPN